MMNEKPENPLDDPSAQLPESLDERLRREEPPISEEDTTQRQPAVSLDERLRREEPPIQADDTPPSRQTGLLGPPLEAEEPPVAHDTPPGLQTELLSAQLEREEPPVSAEDTPQRQPAVSLDERLRQEEPPILADDTSPSLIMRPLLPGQPPPARQRRWWLQTALVAVMLLGGLGLLAAVGYLWLSGDKDSSDEPSGPVAQNPQSATATLSASPITSSPPAPVFTLTSVAADDAVQFVPPALPTAAADELAVALLTPAPDTPPLNAAFQRRSEPFTILPVSARANVVQYQVQQGDTLETIAEKFGLKDIYTIIWSNKSSRVNPLRVGVELTIMPEDGIYYEVAENMTIRDLAERYKVDPYAIIDADYNNLFGSTPDTILPQGMRVAVPGGEGERMILLAANTTSGGSSGGGGGSISGTYSLWGCTAEVVPGSLPVNRPLGGYTWMRGFTPGYHEGVDLAADTGTPVYAAGAGTVVYSGYNNTGYGNVVVIAHGAAFSLYGHLNERSVSCGQQVSAGQVIGAIGTTGTSSGPHLHFETRDANFIARNPEDYQSF